MNFGLLMSLVCNIGNNLMSDKINHPHFIPLTVQYHKVVVVPVVILAIDHEPCGKGGNPTFVLVLFGHSANHFDLFPGVNAFRDVGLVGGVFEIVNKDLLAVLVENVSVEEGDVFWADSRVYGEECAVHFVNPV